MEDLYSPQIEETLEFEQDEEIRKLREEFITDFTTLGEVNKENVHLVASYLINNPTLATMLCEELKEQLNHRKDI